MFMLNLFRRQFQTVGQMERQGSGRTFEEESRVHEWKRVGKRKTGRVSWIVRGLECHCQW